MNPALVVFTLMLSSFVSAETIIKIGLASNFSELSTVSFNPYGGYFRNGVNLALEHHGKRLNDKKIKIQLKEYDYGAEDLNVIKIVNEADKDGMTAVLGYNYSSNALIAAPLHVQRKLPMLSPSASANRLGVFGRYVHLGSFSNEYMSRVLAGFARKELKAKKVAIVPAANCAYCIDLTKTFEAEFIRLGGSVVEQVPVLQEDKDFKEVAEKLKGVQFDAVFIPNQELTAARIILALLEAGIRTPFLGADGWGNEGSEFFSVLKGKQFNGYSVTHWHPRLNAPDSRSFVQAYQEKFGKLPNDSSVLAYDFTNFLIEGIVRCKKFDRESLEDCLQKISEFRGITGRYLMSPNKAPQKDILLLKTSQGKFVVDRSIKARRGQP